MRMGIGKAQVMGLRLLLLAGASGFWYRSGKRDVEEDDLEVSTRISVLCTISSDDLRLIIQSLLSYASPLTSDRLTECNNNDS